jgi:hypothetical protein
MCRYSSGARLSVAASISSTRLMPEVYHRPVQDFILPENRSIPTPLPEKTPRCRICPPRLTADSDETLQADPSPFQTTATIPCFPKIKAAPGSEAGAAMTQTLCRNLFRAYLEALSKTIAMAY